MFLPPTSKSEHRLSYIAQIVLRKAEANTEYLNKHLHV